MKNFLCMKNQLQIVILGKMFTINGPITKTVYH